MPALRILLPLFVLFVKVSIADENVYPRIVVQPDQKGQAKVLNTGESVTFTCIFEASENDQNTKAAKLYWMDKYNTELAQNPSMPVYTMPVSGKLKRMLLLVINGDPAISHSTYSCGADYNGESLPKKSVSVVVYSPPRWMNEAEEVSGTINEAVEINCESRSAFGSIHIDTVMTFKNNSQIPFNESDRYNVLPPHSSILRIHPLTMAERNASIRCTALETHPEQGVMLRNDKTVKINVRFKPVFGQSDLVVTAVAGSSLSLPCQVIDSNPPVANFEFFSGQNSIQLQDNSKYKIDTDNGKQLATLTIFDLTEEDFNVQYYCDAETEDRNFRSRMTFTLQQLFPPVIPEVACKGVGIDSLQFNITELPLAASAENTPVHGYEFRMVQYDTIKGLNESQKKDEFAKAHPRFLNKTDSNLYTLNNLYRATTYTLEIRAVNEAGYSSPFLCNATTLGVVSSGRVRAPCFFNVLIAVTFSAIRVAWPAVLGASRQ